MLSHWVIGADGTRWRLMGTKGEEAKRWQVWALAAPDALCYRIRDSRSMEAAQEVLKDYRGVVMADGYGVYDGLANRAGTFTVAHGWAHVRRKFVEAEAFFPGLCGEALSFIGELYDVERLCPTGPPGHELRRRLRDERSREIVRRLSQRSLDVRALPESALGKAPSYMHGLWRGRRALLRPARERQARWPRAQAVPPHGHPRRDPRGERAPPARARRQSSAVDLPPAHAAPAQRATRMGEELRSMWKRSTAS